EKTPRDKHFTSDGSELCFHLDPLDGTFAYLEGMREYTIGAAFSHNNEFIASAVYFPSFDKLYTVRRKKVVKIQNSQGKELSFIRKRDPEKKYTQKRCEEFKSIIEKIGLEFDDTSKSAHNTMIAVAEGRLSMQMYHLASPHDFGIPQLFVEEAGGICTDLNGDMINYNDDFERLEYFLAFYDKNIKERFFNELNQRNAMRLSED
ncbi:MAG: inositol monophosphatase family protein, partial [Candidatus Hodarchaeales archaeon]